MHKNQDPMDASVKPPVLKETRFEILPGSMAFIDIDKKRTPVFYPIWTKEPK